jgi:hypothetical protein
MPSAAIKMSIMGDTPVREVSGPRGAAFRFYVACTGATRRIGFREDHYGEVIGIS